MYSSNFSSESPMGSLSGMEVNTTSGSGRASAEEGYVGRKLINKDIQLIQEVRSECRRRFQEVPSIPCSGPISAPALFTQTDPSPSNCIPHHATHELAPVHYAQTPNNPPFNPTGNYHPDGLNDLWQQDMVGDGEERVEAGTPGGIGEENGNFACNPDKFFEEFFDDPHMGTAESEGLGNQFVDLFHDDANLMIEDTTSSGSAILCEAEIVEGLGFNY